MLGKISLSLLYFVCILFFSCISGQEVITGCNDYGSVSDKVYILQEDIQIEDVGQQSCIQFTNSQNIRIEGRGHKMINSLSNVELDFILFEISNSVNISFVDITLLGSTIKIDANTTLFDRVTMTSAVESILSPSYLNNLEIKNSQFTTFSKFGKVVLTYESDNVSIHDCNFVSNAGIEIGRTSSTIVSRNYFEVPQNSVTDFCPIKIGSQPSVDPYGNVIIEDNTMFIAPNYQGHGMRIEGLTPGFEKVTVTNNFIQAAYNQKNNINACSLLSAAIKLVGAREAFLTNNTVKDMQLRFMPKIECNNEPTYGGFYIANIGELTIDGADISLAMNTVPSYKDTQYYPNSVQGYYGIYIIKTNATISNVHIHDIQAPKRFSYPDNTNTPGGRAVGLYIDAECVLTSLKNVKIEGIYGGTSSFIYKAEGPGPYNNPGADAIGILWTSGDINFDNVNISNVIGGNGFEIIGQNDVNCTGGNAFAFIELSPGVKNGIPSISQVYDGLSCIVPSTGKSLISTCFPNQAPTDIDTIAFVNGEVHLTEDLIMGEGVNTCFEVKYAQNVTFYGDGFSIDCVDGGSCDITSFFALKVNQAANVVVDGFKVTRTGIVLDVVSNVSVINSEFYGPTIQVISLSGLQSISGPATFVVKNNTFTNVENAVSVRPNDIFEPRTGFEMNLTIIENNVFVNTTFSAISVKSINAVVTSNKIRGGKNTGITITTNYGQVSENIVSDGFFSVGIQSSWTLVSSNNLFTNNIVENIYPAAAFDGISLGGGFTPVPGGSFIGRGNIVRNIKAKCNTGMNGMYTQSATFLLENNTVENFGVLDICPGSTGYISAINSVYSAGTFKDFVVRDVYSPAAVPSQTFVQYYGVPMYLQGLYATISGPLILENCLFENFYVGTISPCDGCWDNSAPSLFAILSLQSIITVSNSRFNNFTAANGGDITNPPGHFVTSFGGDVVGVRSVLFPNSNFEIKDSIFSNFTAGTEGNFDGEHMPCSMGRAEIFEGYNTGYPLLSNNTQTNFYGGDLKCAKILACGTYTFSNTYIAIAANITNYFNPECIILLDNHNIKINGYERWLTESKSTQVFLTIVNSTNVEAFNIIFDGSTAVINGSSNITFHSNKFNGLLSGIQIVGNEVDYVNISYNSFTNSQTAISSTSAIDIFISDNNIENAETAIMVGNAQIFTVKNNVIIDNTANYSVVVSGDRGEVLNNKVTYGPAINAQGSLLYPFYLSVLGDLSSVTHFSGNEVLGAVVYDCSELIGMNLQCSNSQSIVAFNNKIESFTANCTSRVVGMLISSCQLSLDNNIVRGLSGVETSDKAPDFIGFNLRSTSGTVRNSVVDGLYPGPNAGMPTKSGVSAFGFMISGTHTLRNTTVLNIAVSDTPECVDCRDASGKSAAALYVIEGQITIWTLRVDGISAGNGGNISSLSQAASEYESNGGNAAAIWLPNNLASVSASNTAYHNFVAGYGGSFDGAYSSNCSGGFAMLKYGECALCVLNITFYGSLDSSNIQNGHSCQGDVAVTTSAPIDTTTTGADPGETTSTTGEATTGQATTTDEPTTTGDTTTTTTTTTAATTSDSTTTTSDSTTTTTTSTTSDSTTTTSTTTGGATTTDATSSTTGVTTTGGVEAPSQPTNVKVIPLRKSIALSWDPPVQQKRAILHYVVSYRTGGNNWTEYTVEQQKYTILGLEPNTTYSVQLVAIGSGGIGTPVLITETTLPTTRPSKPAPPSYSQFSRTTIDALWHAPEDDGGLPLEEYNLQIFNRSIGWVNLVVNNTLSYRTNGLTIDSYYQFRVAAKNSLGYSNFSESALLNTAQMICGDGICDPGVETCSNCFLDCGSCGYKTCPGNPTCGGKGTCYKGACTCNSGWSGSSCELMTVPVIIEVNDTTPESKIELGDGDQQKTTHYVTFKVSFYDIGEVNPSGVLTNSYLFSQQNFTVTKPNTTYISQTESLYSTILPNGAIVAISISTFSEDTDFIFANETIQVAKDGVKYAMSVSNWPFTSFTNKLQVRMESNGDSNNKENECYNVDTSVDDSKNLRWLKITINGAVLYGKFSEVALVDTKLQQVQFAYNSATSLVDITIPHFWETAAFDPDFRVLFDEENVKLGCDEKKSKTGVIVGATIGSVVGCALLVGAGMLVYHNKRRAATKKRLKLAQHKKRDSMYQVPSEPYIGMQQMSSSSPLYSSNEGTNPLFSQ